MRIEGVSSGVYAVQSAGKVQGGQTKRVEPVDGVQGETLFRERKITEDQLIRAVDKANKSFEPFDRKFEISVHEKTKSIMVKVIDSSNDEVIREVPPEKILDMVAYMLEVAGILVDKRG